MAYFLVKADPDTDYSIADLKRDGVTIWDGVHNYAAIGHIKAMKPGDKVFIYHSQKAKSIVGLAEVLEPPFENTNDPRFSWAVKLGYVETFKTPLTLAQVKSEAKFKDFALVKQSRLSVMPVADNIAKLIL